ncbi:hypothetical protein Slin15195_G101290 [Septoria linicola]|uniref:Uncharacterized protein n=1 Tax=Septoria linicola TaxID=215465 RepID=A0A9Q9AX85_9PEZI|nr:hypothetical protein Slin15195_G101290 [Septoria linicola]
MPRNAGSQPRVRLSTFGLECYHAAFKAFRDAIIDSLYQRCEREETQLNTAWLVDIISVIYNGTTDSSGARQFVTDLCIVKTVNVELSDHSEDLPKDFFRDLARKYHVFQGYEETQKRWREPKCHYHSHRD